MRLFFLTWYNCFPEFQLHIYLALLHFPQVKWSPEANLYIPKKICNVTIKYSWTLTMDRFLVRDHTDFTVLLLYKLFVYLLYWTIISFYTIYITCTTHLDVSHIPAPDPDFELVVRKVPLKLWGPHQGGGDTDIAPWPGPKDRNRVQYRHDPINQLFSYTTQLAYSVSTTHNMQTKSHRKTCHSHF